MPDPPAGKYLVEPTGVYPKEFDYVFYSCKNGAHLGNVVGNPDVIDGKFRVQCGQGGAWPNTAAISWPQCTVEKCVTIPSLTDFQVDRAEENATDLVPQSLGIHLNFRP